MNEWVKSLPPNKVWDWIDKNGIAAKERHHTDDVYFALWLTFFDKQCLRGMGVSYSDMEDWDYRSAYDEGMSPRAAFIAMTEDLEYAWWESEF